METKEQERSSGEKHRRSRAKPLLGILLVLLLVVLALEMLPRFGVDLGFGGAGDTGSAAGTAVAPTEAVQRGIPNRGAGAGTETGQTVEIRVTEDGITVDGSPVDNAEALESYLRESHSDGTEYRLTDAHALRQIYGDVKAVLDDLALEYTETAED